MPIIPGDVQSFVDHYNATGNYNRLDVPAGVYDFSLLPGPPVPFQMRPVSLWGDSLTSVEFRNAPGIDVLRFPADTVSSSFDITLRDFTVAMTGGASHSYDRVLPNGAEVGAAAFAAVSDDLGVKNNIRWRMENIRTKGTTQVTAADRAATFFSNTPVYGLQTSGCTFEGGSHGVVTGCPAARRIASVDPATDLFHVPEGHGRQIGDPVYLVGLGSAPTGYEVLRLDKQETYTILADGFDATHFNIGPVTDTGSGQLWVAPGGATLGELAHDEFTFERMTIFPTLVGGFGICISSTASYTMLGGKIYYVDGALALANIPSFIRKASWTSEISMGAEYIAHDGVTPTLPHAFEIGGFNHNLRRVVSVSHGRSVWLDCSNSKISLPNFGSDTPITITGNNNLVDQVFTSTDPVLNGHLIDNGQANTVQMATPFGQGGLQTGSHIAYQGGVLYRDTEGYSRAMCETPDMPYRRPSDLFMLPGDMVEQPWLTATGKIGRIPGTATTPAYLTMSDHAQGFGIEGTNGMAQHPLDIGRNVPAGPVRVYVGMRADMPVDQTFRVYATDPYWAPPDKTISLTTSDQVFSIEADLTSQSGKTFGIAFPPVAADTIRYVSFIHIVPYAEGSLQKTITFADGETLDGAKLADIESRLAALETP